MSHFDPANYDSKHLQNLLQSEGTMDGFTSKGSVLLKERNFFHSKKNSEADQVN